MEADRRCRRLKKSHNNRSKALIILLSWSFSITCQHSVEHVLGEIVPGLMSVIRITNHVEPLFQP
jgi:hypothetical protein